MSNREKGHGMAWSVAGMAVVLASVLAFMVPQAVAQTASGDNPDSDTRLYLGELDNTFRFILQNYVDKPDAKKLYEGAMKGMFEALGDPYSYFLDEGLMSDMTDLTSGQFGGVGLYISKQVRDPKKGDDQPLYIEVESPIEDTPGAKYGIQAGDLIVKINGESTVPLSSSEAQQKIRGPVGSTVVLSIRRGEAEFDASLVRARIEIPTVKHALIPTAKGNIAYLRIIEFTSQTKAAFDEAIKSFDKEGYRALIIDVRNDGGGVFQAVVQVADSLIDSGVIVSTKGRNPFENSVDLARHDVEVSQDKPIILLINKGSASASEILAGALKDNKRAYLVGENTYGKGSVQQIYSDDSTDSTGYRMTIARYYTPSDENIDKTGIPPDLEVKEPEFTEAQAADLSKLYDSGELDAFSKAHPDASVDERNAFADSLSRRYALPGRVLRILVKNQLGRTKPAPVYDLEFDDALNTAIKLIDDPNYPKLLADVKTVKELVEAKKAALAAKAAAAAGTQSGSTSSDSASTGSTGTQPPLPAPAPKN
jgi:carboxyl-terminal processing protease